MNRCLTHWGRVTPISVSKLNIINSDNGLSPGRCQAIIWTNAGILLLEPLGTNFSEILMEIYTLWFKKMHFKMSSGNWQPIYLDLNVLKINEVLGQGSHQCKNLYFLCNSHGWDAKKAVISSIIKFRCVPYGSRTIFWKCLLQTLLGELIVHPLTHCDLWCHI